MLKFALNAAHSGKDAFLQRCKTFLSIPSISTLPEHAKDIHSAAQWLAEQLRALEMTSVEIIPTAGHPVVWAEWMDAPGKPVLLVYGHYDVQPVDPLNEWESDPFVPTIRGENLYARGASDMKGSMAAFLEAVACLKQSGGLPVNLRVLFEGEEEVGSPNLAAFIEQNRERLHADAVVNCDGEIHGSHQPSITYSLRGLAYFELEVHGPKQDLHSGIFGGSIHNPAQVLCELIAGMHDADGRVTLPGFYDTVRLLADDERTALAQTPLTDGEWKSIAGVPALWGEQNYTTLERTGARPTLEVNGLVSGFIGEGAKTVLPAKALAKISTRLVADQDPAAIKGQLLEYLRRNAPNTVTWELRELSHAPGALMDRHSPAMHAAVDALRDTFDVEPIFKREGGSVPVVSLMQQMLGLDSIMLGFRLPDDGIHGPNEKQHIPTLLKAIEAYVRFMMGLGALTSNV